MLSQNVERMGSMVMQARPVMMLSHDEQLWRHWKRVPADTWLPAKGDRWDDLSRWQARGLRLVVLDAGLPDLPSLDSAQWRKAVASGDVVVASLKPDDEHGRRFLASGAKGYVHGYMPPEALNTVLKVVSDGGVWMGASLLTRLLQQLDRGAAAASANVDTANALAWHTGLTPREKEVAQRAAIGLANQAIADELGITERTVRAHISAIFDKLGVTDRLKLALIVHGISS